MSQTENTTAAELNEDTDDPRELMPKPPYPQAPQAVPGHEAQMTPTADHGEKSYQGSGKLTDKVALITGGDSGIGRAIALAFAREGADVVISYLSEDDDARETERLVTEAGRRALTIAGDIADEGHCRRMIQRTVREFGKIDILVNNAAYQKTIEHIGEVNAEMLEKHFRTNIFSYFYLCSEAMKPGMMGPGGSIINTCSIQGYQPSPTLLPYATTKASIVAFTKGLAKMAAQQGVRVNCVAPGPVWTPLIPSTLPEEQVKTFGQDTPLGRAAQPAELAPVYVLLASEQASYITGAIYAVTGGEITA